jgi:hypothetical protein
VAATAKTAARRKMRTTILRIAVHGVDRLPLSKHRSRIKCRTVG